MHAHIGEPANVYMYMYTCMQTYTHKNRPTCIHIYIYTYIYYICMRTHTYIRTGPSIYIYISQKRPTTGPKETYYRPKYIYIYIYIYIAHACIHINIQEPANIDQHHASYTDIIRQGRIHDIQDVYLYIYKNRPTSTDVMFAPQISFDKDAGTKQRKSAHTTCTV
jgi:hypothetical protein